MRPSSNNVKTSFSKSVVGWCGWGIRGRKSTKETAENPSDGISPIKVETGITRPNRKDKASKNAIVNNLLTK